VAGEMQKQFTLKQPLAEEKQKLVLIEKQRQMEQLQRDQDRCLFEGNVRLQGENVSRSEVEAGAMTVSLSMTVLAHLTLWAIVHQRPRTKLKTKYAPQQLVLGHMHLHVTLSWCYQIYLRCQVIRLDKPSSQSQSHQQMWCHPQEPYLLLCRYP